MKLKLRWSLALMGILAVSDIALCSQASPLTPSATPADNTFARQNPPTFRWPAIGDPPDYELTITEVDGGKRTSIRVPRTWHLPPLSLRPGKYSWTVRPSMSRAAALGPFVFTIPVNALSFVVASDDELLARIRSRATHRSLPVATGQTESLVSDLTRRKDLISALAPQVREFTRRGLLSADQLQFVPRSVDERLWAQSLSTIRNLSLAEMRQIRAASLLWRVTGDRDFLAEAVRRGEAVTALDVNGSTSHASQDQANRAIAWGLSVAFDLLEDDLTLVQRQRWLDVIGKRVQPMYDDLASDNWRLEQSPLDSHAANHFAYVAAISALMVDRLGQAETWFRTTFRSYASYVNPWGDEQGGFANGTAYGEYAIAYMLDTWDVIKSVTGVDLYGKPWSRGMLDFMTCFVPPGSPTHQFGDEAEVRPNGGVLKAFAGRYRHPLA